MVRVFRPTHPRDLAPRPPVSPSHQLEEGRRLQTTKHSGREVVIPEATCGDKFYLPGTRTPALLSTSGIHREGGVDNFDKYLKDNYVVFGLSQQALADIHARIEAARREDNPFADSEITEEDLEKLIDVSKMKDGAWVVPVSFSKDTDIAEYIKSKIHPAFQNSVRLYSIMAVYWCIQIFDDYMKDVCARKGYLLLPNRQPLKAMRAADWRRLLVDDAANAFASEWRNILEGTGGTVKGGQTDQDCVYHCVADESDDEGTTWPIEAEYDRDFVLPPLRKRAERTSNDSYSDAGFDFGVGLANLSQPCHGMAGTTVQNLCSSAACPPGYSVGTGIVESTWIDNTARPPGQLFNDRSWMLGSPAIGCCSTSRPPGSLGNSRYSSDDMWRTRSSVIGTLDVPLFFE